MAEPAAKFNHRRRPAAHRRQTAIRLVAAGNLPVAIVKRALKCAQMRNQMRRPPPYQLQQMLRAGAVHAKGLEGVTLVAGRAGRAGQVKDGIRGDGLGKAAVEVALDEGRPVPANFDTYRSLRIHEMPEVEVTILPSTEKPTGVGEPGVPPIGPAVANAMARLGLGRPRQLPIVREAV